MLKDKLIYYPRRSQIKIGTVNDLSDSVKKKYVSLKDLKTVLVEEYDIHLN